MIAFSDVAPYAALILSVLSPVVTAIIYTKHDIKIEKMRSIDKRKREVIEGFVRCANYRLYKAGDEPRYHEYEFLVYAYTNKLIHPVVDEIREILSGAVGNTDTTDKDNRLRTLLYELATKA